MRLWHGHVVFKLSIFVIQKATAPKNGVEFRQGSIGTIMSILATSYDVWRHRQFSTNQRPRNYLTQTHQFLTNQRPRDYLKLTDTHRINILSGPNLLQLLQKLIVITNLL